MSLPIDTKPFATSSSFLFTILTAWLTVKFPSTYLTPTAKSDAPFSLIAKEAPSSKVIFPTVWIACESQLFLLPIGFSTG